MRKLASLVLMTKKSAIRTILILAFATLLTAAIIYQSFHNTIHVVIPGNIYRSAQLPPSKLGQVISQQHIQSVINLRGPNPKNAWYQKEVKETEKHGIHHFDVTLSSYQLPRVTQLQKLIHLLETAPRPILLHCQSGIDRTGLASAFALILDKNASLKTAKHQFSLFYMDTSRGSIGKKVFPYYAFWLQKNNLENNETNLHKWAFSDRPFSQQDPVLLGQLAYEASHKL